MKREELLAVAYVLSADEIERAIRRFVNDTEYEGGHGKRGFTMPTSELRWELDSHGRPITVRVVTTHG